MRIFQKTFSEYELIYPQKRISWRKNGNIINLIRPLFEGYLFVSASQENINKFDLLLHKYRLNIAWLVRCTGALMPILADEQQLIQNLMGSEGIVEISEINKTTRKITKGPLIGMEHIIKKFSPRNRRITVEVPILKTIRKIELDGVLVDFEQTPDR